MYESSDQGFCLIVFVHRILWSPTSKENPPTYEDPYIRRSYNIYIYNTVAIRYFIFNNKIYIKIVLTLLKIKKNIVSILQYKITR